MDDNISQQVGDEAAWQKRPTKRRLIILIIVLAAILFVGVAGGVFWLYNNKKQRVYQAKSDKLETARQEALEKKADEKYRAKLFNDQTERIYKTDKDMDGLDETEEKKYGTNPDSPDTDADGILDKDEIALYKTNPLKADTDGDGFQDGNEIRHGYNPLGSGKL